MSVAGPRRPQKHRVRGEGPRVRTGGPGLEGHRAGGAPGVLPEPGDGFVGLLPANTNLAMAAGCTHPRFYLLGSPQTRKLSFGLLQEGCATDGCPLLGVRVKTTRPWVEVDG